MRLSIEQKRILSEFLANIGVAWFAGGIVAPLFISNKITEIIIPGVWGLILSIISLSFSLLIVKKKA